ncbi:Asp23/Gls24 family envelope stress response protein [uncultured Pseudokineococcus sp.]|uniref:Asp23/Gls24 family envelope stress response protein n=1 Tax=uncultured Pseudokineococcus sp. TaxID=1642928 RepID=UPI00261B4AB7|nr:Asp23/Gls24 family envelope stress response protein [uncultured Pseudokineococcus sp.]
MAEAPAAAGASTGEPSSATGSDDGADRGHLVVADRVLQRIAVVAAREVDGVAPDDGGSGPLGRLFSSGYPAVEVDQAGSRVRVQVDVAALWPRPAAQVAGGVRDAVARRLGELTGVRVDAVTVTVRDVVRRHPRQQQEARVR